MRKVMSADKSRPSYHRDRDAAISAVAPATAPGAPGLSPGVNTRIDAGRASLAMSPAGNAHWRPRSAGRLAKAGNGNEMKGREERLTVHTGRAAQIVETWRDLRRASPCHASAPRSVGRPTSGNGAESRSDPGKNSRQRSKNMSAIVAVYSRAYLAGEILPIDRPVRQCLQSFGFADGHKYRKREGAGEASI